MIIFKYCQEILGFEVNNNYHLNDDFGVVLKVLDLDLAPRWLKDEGYTDPESHDIKLKKLKEQMKNEIMMYERIWKHKEKLSSDSDSFIHVPRIIGHGESVLRFFISVMTTFGMFLDHIWFWKS
ncbi:unnamed protein product [Ambrosiozyma monospora]|uniref:Unnamed protein product n=1 Tax=Ambrosiozyma monospora TaxID=43982 RepID=A0ACB5U3X4_AMBMO|nr:unnamed protein product [Ambrosiozyma monospora]